MKEAGVFRSAKPENEVPEWVKNYEAELDSAIASLKKK